MNYYSEIKKELVDNEVYKKIKDYSKNRYELEKYYNVGKLLIEAQGGEHRAKYGDGLIKEYSKKLVFEVSKRYNERTLRRMRQFYILFKGEKWSPMATKLSWSHYTELLPIKDINKVCYYVDLCMNNNLSKRELRQRIKSNEYERLNGRTKNKLITNEEKDIGDFIKHPIMLKNIYDSKLITEKMLKNIILENVDDFLNELGNGFCYIGNEYKIKLGGRYNYIDLLLFNIDFNCYVVVELKVVELRKEHIGQIRLYMNYIDENIKRINHNKTIGIIIAKENNEYVIRYCYNNNIYETTYELV